MASAIADLVGTKKVVWIPVLPLLSTSVHHMWFSSWFYSFSFWWVWDQAWFGTWSRHYAKIKRKLPLLGTLNPSRELKRELKILSCPLLYLHILKWELQHQVRIHVRHFTYSHSVWKSQKKSHSTFRAKQATLQNFVKNVQIIKKKRCLGTLCYNKKCSQNGLNTTK